MSEIKVVDVSYDLTREELESLKRIAKYYGAGKIALAVIIGLGAASLALSQIFDLFHHTLNK